MSEPGDPDYEECLPPGLVKLAEVVGTSNEHHWISYGGRGSGSSAIICCCHCGVVRRADNQNKTCRSSSLSKES